MSFPVASRAWARAGKAIMPLLRSFRFLRQLHIAEVNIWIPFFRRSGSLSQVGSPFFLGLGNRALSSLVGSCHPPTEQIVKTEKNSPPANGDSGVPDGQSGPVGMGPFPEENAPGEKKPDQRHQQFHGGIH